jgi:methionine sulfoxide reductase heme-binding subunit
MTYQGLGTRTSWARWGLAAIAVGIIAGAFVPDALRGLARVWEGNRASLPWLFERVFAYLAYLAMTGSVVYGLLLSTRLLDVIAHRPVTYTLHQDLASIGVGLAGVHGMLLGLDHSIGFSIAQILVPGLSSYQPVPVALGQVSLYLSMVVLGSFYVRRFIGRRAWRTLHYVTFLAFLGATVHGIAAGTDSGSAWAQLLYVGSAAVVAFLLAYRVGLVVAERAGYVSESRAAERLDRIRQP